LLQPLPRANWVIRERLLARLDRGLDAGRRLILVSAPAGAGKTTLLAHWLAARPIRAAWLSLDPEDDNLDHFWSYVVQALQIAMPGLGQAAAEAFAAQVPPPLPSVLPGLLNEIGALGEPLVLVLDDYHVLANRAIHETIASVVDHLPEPLRLVICTRADPQLSLARWRARDELIEVREADLRFTPEEALALLNQRMGLHLQIEDVERLVEQTEGWAVGLQLAALSLQGQPDPTRSIRSLAGGRHFMLEYLLEEVLARQPESIQRFLLHTSILGRMCGPLCDAVTGEGGGAATLAELQRQNLFVVPLDEERFWYRYHRLFADLLRARLLQTAPDQARILHQRASEWWEANGFVAEAVRHALAARDWERAAHLFEAREQDWWTGSDVGIIGNLIIEQLPVEVVLASPNLSVYKAWGLLLRGQLEASAALLADVERTLAAGEPREEHRGLLAFVAIQQAHIAELTGSPGPQDIEAYLGRVPDSRGGMRDSAEVVVAYLLFRTGDFAGAARWLQATIDRDRRTGATNGIAIAASRLARMWIVEGRLQEAEELCRRCQAVLDERGRWRFYIAGNVNVVLGDVLCEWNQLDAAEACVCAGIQDNEPWGIPHAYALGYTALARVLLARGDVSAAIAALARQQELTRGRTIHPDLESETRAIQMRIWLADRNLEAAGRWAAEWANIANVAPDFRNEQDLITLARAWLSLGHPEPAARLLARLQESAARGGRRRRSVEILALLARARHGLGQGRSAGEALAQALALAAPMGCSRVFLDEGPEMMRLVTAASEREGLSPGVQEFARCILASSPDREPQATAGPCYPAAPALVEPLTPREQEVLGLLAAGYSNRDIADKLAITVAAVKKHTGNIYGKMAVTSRTQAVLRARELGMLGA
ncbi:MAG: LuxR C-terminal-related transcriptional regulator, partial [Nitrososphaerales archaeon]